MTDTNFDRRVATRERWRLFIDRGILAVFLVAGSLSVILLKLSAVPLVVRIGVPVAAILMYAGLTLSRTRFRLRYDQAGDNCYYMGFIFTLVALGVALYQIQSEMGVREYGIGVVKDFGLALSTTVVGIICRVSLSQLREDSHDIEEATRRELIEYSRALSGQMQASVSMLAEVRQTTEDRLKNYVFEMAQVVKEHQTRTEELRDSTQQLANSVKSLAADLASTEIPTGKLRAATSSTLEAIDLLSETLRRANSALGEIVGASRRVTESYDKNSAAGLNVAAHEAKVADTMTASALATAALAERTRQLTETLQAALVGAGVYKAMSDEVRNVTDALRSATQSIGGTNSKLGAAEAALSSHFETAERAAKSLTQRIEDIISAQERLRQFEAVATASAPAAAE